MKILFATMLMAAILSAAAADPRPEHSKPAASAGVKNGFINVDPETFDKLRKTDTNAVVLDVRTKEEYKQGHIPGSVLIDFISPDFEKEVARLDKNKTYLVHCASGGRSSRACKKMDQLHFSKLYNLKGGMNAWEKAGKPVEK